MRATAFAFLLVAVAFAGCASEPPESDPGRGPAAREEPAEADPLAGLPEFCEDQRSCDFWDELFHEYVLYDLDTTHLDVLIVPGATESPVAHLEAARLAAEGWAAGIAELAAPWFAQNFTMATYVLGRDVPPAEALADPEVIIVFGGIGHLVGVGLEPKQFACLLQGGYPVHAHHGMEVRAADCTGLGFTCLAVNAAGSPGGERALYDLISHELGHCLGIGHVGDALDFRARYAPIRDIMSYQHDPSQVHCVSTLNVRTLEGVYAHLLDRPAEERLPRGSFYAMDPRDYRQVTCGNPPPS